MRVAYTDIKIETELREHVPRWIAYGVPVFTVVAALVFGAFPLLAAGINPFAAYAGMIGNILTGTGLSEMIVRSIPLMLAGLAVYIPLKAGLWNIAAEAQIYIGGIAAMWIGLNVHAPSYVVVPLMVIGGGVAGAFLGFVPGYLRAKWGVNEILVTLLLTFAFIQFNEYAIQAMPAPQLIHGSAPLPEIAYFPRLVGRIHIGLFVAIVAAAVIYLMMNRMKLGYEITMFGSNPEASRQAGISSYKIIIGTMVIGGILAGLAGAGEIGGIHRRLQPEFSPGFGFTAIAIALLGRNGVIQVALGALLFGALFVGGAHLETVYAVPFAIVDILEALVILFLITAVFFTKYKVRIERVSAIPDGGDEQ